MRSSSEWRTAARQALAREGVAVATVADVHGSAFRHEGARLFIWAPDDWGGTISGGCLEPDVALAAQDVLRSGRAATRTYDLAEEDMWGLGLGCGGQVEVLIEPFQAEAYRFVLEQPEGGVWLRPLPPGEASTAAACATDGRAGSGVALDGADGRAGGQREGADPATAPQLPPAGWWWSPTSGWTTVPGPEPSTVATAADLARWAVEARRRFESERSGAVALARLRSAKSPSSADGPMRLFFDVVQPSRRLVVCGAGHDSVPLAELAARAGFRVAVADPRATYATARQFPLADEILLGEPAEELDRLALTPRDAIVIKNHHKQRDRASLAAALRSGAGYIGQLGPRGRTQQMLAEAVGARQSEADPRLHAPVGLDLSAESPEQVAVSVVGELLAWANGHSGGPLTTAVGPIHG